MKVYEINWNLLDCKSVLTKYVVGTANAKYVYNLILNNLFEGCWIEVYSLKAGEHGILTRDKKIVSYNL